jgi:hypothetical protein
MCSVRQCQEARDKKLKRERRRKSNKVEIRKQQIVYVTKIRLHGCDSKGVSNSN